MDRNYWEKIAPAYDEEIFDVLHNDSKKLILSAIKKYNSKRKTVPSPWFVSTRTKAGN